MAVYDSYIISNALRRYLNNPAAWENAELKSCIFDPIIKELVDTYRKRLVNTDNNSATSYSTDGFSMTADTSNIFQAYAPLLAPYRKPRTVSDNDATDWKTDELERPNPDWGF